MNFDEKIVCLKCGSNEFRLTRTVKEQILAECLKCGYPHLMEGVSIFWNPEEEEGTTEEKTYHLRSVEVDKQKIPKEIEEKSVEELANEMVELIKRESLEDLSFYDISRTFWEKKGLDLFMLPHDSDVALKRLKVENSVKERLNYQGEISPKQLKKEKELINSLKCKVVDKARKENKGSLTQTDIELYLMENEKVLPRRLQRILQSLVNSELKR